MSMHACHLFLVYRYERKKIEYPHSIVTLQDFKFTKDATQMIPILRKLKNISAADVKEKIIKCGVDRSNLNFHFNLVST